MTDENGITETAIDVSSMSDDEIMSLSENDLDAIESGEYGQEESEETEVSQEPEESEETEEESTEQEETEEVQDIEDVEDEEPDKKVPVGDVAKQRKLKRQARAEAEAAQARAEQAEQQLLLLQKQIEELKSDKKQPEVDPDEFVTTGSIGDMIKNELGKIVKQSEQEQQKVFNDTIVKADEIGRDYNEDYDDIVTQDNISLLADDVKAQITNAIQQGKPARAAKISYKACSELSKSKQATKSKVTKKKEVKKANTDSISSYTEEDIYNMTEPELEEALRKLES